MKWIFIILLGFGGFWFWNDLSYSTHDNFGGRWKSTGKTITPEVIYANLTRKDDNSYSIEFSNAIDASSKKIVLGKRVSDNEIQIVGNKTRLLYNAKKDVLYLGLLEFEHLDKKQESKADVIFKFLGAL